MHRLVVVGNLVVEIGPVTEYADAQRFLSRDPLVHGPGAIVEVPGHHQTDGMRAQRVQAVEHDAGLDAGHDGTGHSEFGERDATWNNDGIRWWSVSEKKKKNSLIYVIREWPERFAWIVVWIFFLRNGK